MNRDFIGAALAVYFLAGLCIPAFWFWVAGL